MELKPAEEKLTPISMDGLFQDFSPVWRRTPGRRKKFILNLADVKFVDPYAAVTLCLLIETIAGRLKAKPRIIPPQAETVTGYLGRLGFWNHISLIADIQGGIESANRSLLPLDSDVLLELTPIRNAKDVKDITEHLLKIISTNLEYSDKSANKIINLISELCRNILDHSSATGWATAQRYVHANGTRFLQIGVADAGIGIKESLKTRYPRAGRWTHQEAILKALQKDFSRFPKRGLGLYMVHRIVEDFKGHLQLRSGDSRVFLGTTQRGFHVDWFPGVQASISLSERAGA